MKPHSATPHEENLKAYRSELAERIQNSLPGVVPSQSEHRIPLKKVEWDHIIIALVEARRSETATNEGPRYIGGFCEDREQCLDDKKRLRSLIPGCDCDNPMQCWEECGTLGHSAKHAKIFNAAPPGSDAPAQSPARDADASPAVAAPNTSRSATATKSLKTASLADLERANELPSDDKYDEPKALANELYESTIGQGQRGYCVMCEFTGSHDMTCIIRRASEALERLDTPRSSVVANEPVAWRYRLKDTEMQWKCVDTEDECNPLPSYEREPMYAAPQASRSATARWKPDLKQCPYNGWPYPEREAWKAGYHNAMMDYTAFVQGEYAPHESSKEKS